MAFVKDENKEDEIGYRFLEKYWDKGYGTEIVDGMITYCKKVGFPFGFDEFFPILTKFHQINRLVFYIFVIELNKNSSKL